MNREIIVTSSARADIENALGTSLEDFGLDAFEAYKALIDQAICDLAEDPCRIGVQQRDDLKPGLSSYHLRFSRRRSGRRRVRDPRHVVLFRADDDTLTISRFLHERMLFSRHPLP